MAGTVDEEEELDGPELPLEMDSDMNHGVSCEPENEQETEDNISNETDNESGIASYSTARAGEM